VKSANPTLRGFILRLVVLRRFEQCTLHEAMTGVKTREFPWLFGKPGECGGGNGGSGGGGKASGGGKVGGSGTGGGGKDCKGAGGKDCKGGGGKGAAGGSDGSSKVARRGGPASASISRRRHLQRWVRWLIAELAIPLLRAHFYCTETESHRLRVFYYRKGVWARLTAAHLAAMTDDLGWGCTAVESSYDP
jgi:telomerase reverse transcriptase